MNRPFTIMLLAAAGLPCARLAQAAPPPSVLPAHAAVAGRTIADWSAAWWQWAASFSSPNDPLDDTTGQFASLNQSGPVFFLAGSSGGNAVRTFTIPSDKYVLIPLGVVEWSQLEAGDSTPATSVRQTASDIADLCDSLSATLDGHAVPDLFAHREVSDAFSFTAAPNNAVFIVPADPMVTLPAPSGNAFANGYWLMLAPLHEGRHVFRFGAGFSAFDYSFDITDTINVGPPARGACCRIDGHHTTCSVKTTAQCDHDQGNYQGDNTACGPRACPSTCPCDWTNDGHVNQGDINAFVRDWLAGRADFNASGATDPQDLADFLGCYLNPPAGCAR